MGKMGLLRGQNYWGQLIKFLPLARLSVEKKTCLRGEKFSSFSDGNHPSLRVKNFFSQKNKKGNNFFAQRFSFFLRFEKFWRRGGVKTKKPHWVSRFFFKIFFFWDWGSFIALGFFRVGVF